MTGSAQEVPQPPTAGVVPLPDRGPGFSLVELVVALAVGMVGLMVASGILIQAHRMLAQSSVHALSPVADLAILRLRADLQGAAGVDPGPGTGGPAPAGWSRSRLALIRSDGGSVVYENRRGRLVRSVDPAGGESGPRFGSPILDGVVSWRWRRSAPRLVTVELIFERPGPGAGRIVDPARRGRGRGERITVRMTAALRGGGLGWGW